MKHDLRAALRRLAAALLVVFLFLNSVGTAFAGIGSGLPAMPKGAAQVSYDQDMLSAVQALCGEDGSAEEILNVLHAYGMVDENGVPVQDAGFVFTENGESSVVTMEELEALTNERMAQEMGDSSILLDGAELSWSELCALFTAKNTLAEIQAWMNTGYTFGDADMDKMDLLAAQIAAEGFTLNTKTGDMSFGSGSPSGSAPAASPVSDDRINAGSPAVSAPTLTVSLAKSSIDDKSQDVAVNVSLSAAQSVPVSFDVQAASGTAALNIVSSGASGLSLEKKASNGSDAEVYTVTLAAGAAKGSFKIHYTKGTSEKSGDRIGTVQLSNVKNALFSGGKRAQTLILRASCTSSSLTSAEETQFMGNQVTQKVMGSQKPEVQEQQYWCTLDNDVARVNENNGSWEYSYTSTARKVPSDRIVKIFSYRNYLPSIVKDKTGPRRVMVEPYASIEVLNWDNIDDYHIAFYGSISGEDRQSTRFGNTTDFDIHIPEERIDYSLGDTGKKEIEIALFLEPYTYNSAVHMEHPPHPEDCLYMRSEYSVESVVTSASIELTYQVQVGAKVSLWPVPDNNTSLTWVNIPNGTFYPGQQIPITAVFSGDAFKSDEKLKLMVNGSLLLPADINSLGHEVTFLYTVPENCSAAINIEKLYVDDEQGRLSFIHDIDPYTIVPASEYSDAENHIFSLGDNQSKVIGKAKLRAYKDYAFTGLSVQPSSVNPGGYAAVSLPLNGDANGAYSSWIINGGMVFSGIDSKFADRDDLLSVSELEKALKTGFCKNEAWYKVAGYLKNVYLSADGGETRYPVYVITNDEAEKEMSFAAYYKVPLNTSSSDRTYTLRLYVNQTDESIDYFSKEGKLKNAEPLYAAGTSAKSYIPYASYTAKKAVFMKPGDAVISYPDYRLSGNWDNFVNSPALLVSYYADISGGHVLPESGCAIYKVSGDVDGAEINASYTNSKSLTFNDEAYNAPFFDGDGFNATNTYHIEDDTLKLHAEIPEKSKYTFISDEDFLWVSSDEEIASIAADPSDPFTAVIVPTGKSGKVYFSFYASNGGVEGYAPVQLCRSIALYCAAGNTPVLRIAGTGEGASAFRVNQNNPLTISFTSTVATVNKKAYEGNPSAFGTKPLNTEYTLKVYAADINGKPSGSPVYTETKNAVSGAAIAEPGFFRIPEDVLCETRGSSAAYIAEISSVIQTVLADDITEKPIAAAAGIVVKAAPPSVKLKKLDRYSYLDTENIKIGWNTVNVTSDMMAVITVKDADGKVIETKDLRNGEELTLSALFVPSGKLKTSYVISAIVSKDGDAPAIDSCVVTVYNSSAMKLLADGKDVSSLRLDNSGKIANLAGENGVITVADVRTLSEDTSLRAMLSINYGDYAWGQLSDQIKWSARELDEDGNEVYHVISYDEDGNAIRKSTVTPATGEVEDSTYQTPTTLNYSLSGTYGNINDLPYDTYSPYSDFLASGISDGTTRITAVHAATGIKDTLDITTKRLKDKLYLFKFYPAQETTAEYVNGKGEECTVKSNADGTLALYEPESIAGNVRLFSEDANGKTYLFTINHDDLKTGEQDTSKLQNYPINSAVLRDVSTATLYIPKLAGKKLTVRGGVYKNGEYCEDALIGTAFSNLSDGKKAQVFTIGSDGKAVIYTDSSQFYTAEETESQDRAITASDSIEFIFELRFYENGESGKELYEPMLVHVYPGGESTDVTRAGTANVVLREYKQPRYKQPFVVNQFLDLYDRDGSFAVRKDIYDVDAAGISYDYPKAVIETEALMWGEEISDGGASEYGFYFNDKSGTVPDGQICVDATYPFSSIPALKHVWTLDKAAADKWAPSGTSAMPRLCYTIDGRPVFMRSNRWKFTNSSDMNPSSDKDKLQAQADAVDAINSQLDFGSAIGAMKSEADSKTRPAFAFIEGIETDDLPIPVNFAISPTEDGNCFHFVLTIGHGRADETNADDEIKGKEEQGKAEKKENAKVTETKKPDADKAKKEAEDEDEKDYFKIKIGEYGYFAFGGYVMGNLYYREDTGKWTFVFVGGGINADLGAATEWPVNFMVGPVPATMSFKIGVNVGLSFEFVVTYKGQEKGNDFLIDLVLEGYVEAFAGVGFDAGVVAMKLGITGRIVLGNNFKTLIIKDRGSSAKAKVGNSMYVNGSVGLQFTVKVVFVKYSKTFASVSWGKSWDVGQYSYISAYWDARQESKSVKDLGDDEEEDYEFSYIGKEFVDAKGGSPTFLYTIDDRRVETRDYQALGGSVWLGGAASGKRGSGSAANGAAPGRDSDIYGVIDIDNKFTDTVLYNGYSFAAPSYNGDGSVMVYLSDAASAAAEDTVASYALNENGYYVNGASIDPLTYTNDLMNNETYEKGADGKNDPVYYPLSAAEKAGEIITPGRRDERTGYGDSSLTAAGTKDFTAAVWVRETADTGLNSGDSVTDEQLSYMLNGTEVYASIYDGSSWTTSRLTENGTPDMAPAVAVRGDKAVCVWRNVVGSDPANVLNFDTVDNLMYRVYDKKSASWSAPVMVYNGSTGSVQGFSADIDDNGNMLFGYNIQTDADDENSTEIMYTHVASDGAQTSVRLTNDGVMDRCVCVKAAKINEKDSFLAAWYHADDAEGSGGDVQFVSIGAETGMPGGDIYASASSMGIASASGKFTLSAPANGAGLDNMSLVWEESEVLTAPFAQSITTTDSKGNVTKEYYDADGGIVEFTGNEDIYTPNMISDGVNVNGNKVVIKYYASTSKPTLRAARFYENRDGAVYTAGLTAPQELAEFESGTVLDSFAAYSEADGKTVHAVIQSSDYNGMNLSDPDTYELKTIIQQVQSKKTGEIIDLSSSVYTAIARTDILTATSVYDDIKAETEVSFNNEDIIPMFDAPLYFTVTNMGTEPLNKEKVTIAGETESYSETIMPGESKTLILYYSVPEKVINETAKISVSGKSGTSFENIAVTLQRPRIGLYNPRITKEEERERTVEMTLANTTKIPLEGSGLKAKTAVYALAADRIAGENAIAEKTVSGDADLAAIDAGAYTESFTLSESQFAALIKKQYEEFTFGTDEIPENGVILYMRTWIEDAAGNLLRILDEDGSELWTSLTLRNEDIITFRSLNDLYSSGTMKLSAGLGQAPAGYAASVNASIMNTSYVNRLSASDTGLFICLLDAEGKPMSKLKTVQLSTISPEEEAGYSVNFAEADLLSGYAPEDIADVYAACGSTAANPDTDGKLENLIVQGQNFSLVSLLSADPSVSFSKENGKYVVTESYHTSASNDYSNAGIVITAEPANLGNDVTIIFNGGVLASGAGIQMAPAYTSGRGFEAEAVITNGNEETAYYLVPAGKTKETYDPFESAQVFAEAVELEKTPVGTFKDAEGNEYSEAAAKPVSLIRKKSYSVTFAGDMPEDEGVTAAPNKTVTGPAITGAAIAFEDVKDSDYFAKPVVWAVENEITKGIDEKHFGPSKITARAQMVTFLYRAAKASSMGAVILDAESLVSFLDVPKGAFYEEAALWAAMLGITTGTGGGLFSPDAPLTRAQAVTMLYRFAKYMAGEGAELNMGGGAVSFDDVPGDAYYAEAVRWAVANGITTGTGGGNFSPDEYCTRAQVVTFLFRYFASL